MIGMRPFTEAELEAMRSAFTGPHANRNRTLFVLGVNLGFRISELLSLDVGDVVEDDWTIRKHIRVARRNMKGKTRSRMVVVPPPAREALEAWIDELKRDGFEDRTCPLFMATGGGRMGRIQAWRDLKRAARRAGLVGNIATHSMRKTFAARVYERLLDKVAKGEPVDAFRGTSKALGHADIKSTDQYLSFRQPDIDEAIEGAGWK